MSRVSTIVYIDFAKRLKRVTQEVICSGHSNWDGDKEEWLGIEVGETVELAGADVKTLSILIMRGEEYQLWCHVGAKMVTYHMSACSATLESAIQAPQIGE